MATPLLLGVHGVYQSGKGTAFGYVSDWASSHSLVAVERGFANKLKHSLARLFWPDISEADAVKWFDMTKTDPNTRIHILQKNFKDQKVEDVVSLDIREALQRWGTEVGRDLLGENVWVDLLLPLGTDDPAKRSTAFHSLWWKNFEVPTFEEEGQPRNVAHVCGITDVRFPNEMKRLDEVGGYKCKVKNEKAMQAMIDKAEEQGKEIHRSDLEFPDDDFDFVWENDFWDGEYASGDPDHFKKQVITDIESLVV